MPLSTTRALNQEFLVEADFDPNYGEVERAAEALCPRPSRRMGLKLARSIMGGLAFVSWFILLSGARYIDVGPAHPLFIQFIVLGGLLAFTERLIGLHDAEQAINVRVAVALGVVASLVEVLLLFGSAGWNGSHSLLVVATAGVSMTMARIGAATTYRAALRTGFVAKTVIVVGPPSALRREVISDIQALTGVRIVAVLDGGDFSQLGAELECGPVDEVMLVCAGGPERLQYVIDRLEIHAVHVLFITHPPAGPVERRLRFRSPLEQGLMIQHQRQSGGRYLIKRLIDVVCSILGLLVLSPLLALIAAAIKFDSPGPVIFKQIRFGYGGREFLMWKFRSMRNDASDSSGSRLTSRNDNRVTRLGSLLRATSLDELPQLVNILRGELSFVGPRPHPSGARAGSTLYDDLIGNFKARYRVRPGLTGLAQCSGLRGNTDTEEKLIARFAKDMEYVETWTILGDIKILLKTVLQVLGRENAY